MSFPLVCGGGHSVAPASVWERKGELCDAGQGGMWDCPSVVICGCSVSVQMALICVSEAFPSRSHLKTVVL